jgi:hypothetical protein
VSEKAKENLRKKMLSQLSSTVRAELGLLPEEPESDPDAFMSSTTRAELEAAGTLADPPPADEEIEEEAYRYYLVEGRPDLPEPVLRRFETPEAMARHLGHLEDSRQDVYVQMFYGIRLEVTVGPGRFLYLPDGVNALPVPPAKWGKRPLPRVERTLLTQKESEDGYVGPPEFAKGVLMEKLDKLARKKIQAVEDDDPHSDDHPKKNSGDEGDDDAAPPASK